MFIFLQSFLLPVEFVFVPIFFLLHWSLPVQIPVHDMLEILTLYCFCYCLNSCDDSLSRHLTCTGYLHSHNRLFNMGMNWCSLDVWIGCHHINSNNRQKQDKVKISSIACTGICTGSYQWRRKKTGTKTNSTGKMKDRRETNITINWFSVLCNVDVKWGNYSSLKKS